MKIRFEKSRCIIGIVFGLTLAIPCMANDNYVMPQDIVEKAKAKNCNQIANFYKRPGIVAPPYSYLQNEKEGALVFWCERKINTSIEYSLMIEGQSKNGSFSRCEQEIKTKNYPGGLSLKLIKETALSSFVYLKDPVRRGPKASLTKLSIVSEYDGVSEIFYCHNGDWLVLARH